MDGSNSGQNSYSCLSKSILLNSHNVCKRKLICYSCLSKSILLNSNAVRRVRVVRYSCLSKSILLNFVGVTCYNKSGYSAKAAKKSV
mgnify:CR=1 FL=1